MSQCGSIRNRPEQVMPFNGNCGHTAPSAPGVSAKRTDRAARQRYGTERYL
jgi:hypothetical protein